MNIETLKARLEKIESSIGVQQNLIKMNQDQVNQGYANLNALIGSKSECEHWIKELEKSVEAEVEPPKEDENVTLD
jgi:hypothetical protein